MSKNPNFTYISEYNKELESEERILITKVYSAIKKIKRPVTLEELKELSYLPSINTDLNELQEKLENLTQKEYFSIIGESEKRYSLTVKGKNVVKPNEFLREYDNSIKGKYSYRLAKALRNTRDALGRIYKK